MKLAASNPGDYWSVLRIISWSTYQTKSTRGEMLPGLVLTNADELIKEIKIGGCLGCSDHAMVELMISRNMGLTKSKVP